MFSRKTTQSHDVEKGLVRINDSLSLLRLPDEGGNKGKRPTTGERVREIVEGITGRPAKDSGKLDEDVEVLRGNYSHEFAWVRDVHDA
jgi:hypothetical protein